MKKCYSIDDENFQYDDRTSVLEALKDNDQLTVGTTYYEADCQPLAVNKVLSAHNILEMANEYGYDEIGESWDDPFSVNNSAVAELQQLLNTWTKKYVDLSHYYEIVGRSVALQVTEEDLHVNE